MKKIMIILTLFLFREIFSSCEKYEKPEEQPDPIITTLEISPSSFMESGDPLLLKKFIDNSGAITYIPKFT